MKTVSLTLAALATLSLAACNDADQRRTAGAKGICTPFVTAAAAPTSGVPTLAPAATTDATAVEDCLHRWAYSLAGASDTADVVARATVAACSPALSRWNQQSLSPTGNPPGGAVEAMSLVTGEPTNAMVEHRMFADSRALFFVVQARAGKCAPPPAVKSANAG